MYAIVEIAGQQMKVEKGRKIYVHRLENAEGETVVFDKVLLVDNGSDTTIGTPYIPKAAVKGTITKIGRSAKILVVKYKQKSRYFKKNGHRQPWFKVLIDSIK